MPVSAVARATHLPTVTGLALAALLFLACEPEEGSKLGAIARDTGVKIVLVGIDGGSLKVILPMIDQGRLPNFARMIREGAHGELESEKPLRSPAIWTTIATGKSRREHKINSFTVRDPKRQDGLSLVGSLDRKSLALWEMLSATERRVGVLGWWATWPAETVNGWLVSDRITRSRWGEWSNSHQSNYLTHPPALATELRELVVDPDDFPVDELEGLVELTADERVEMLAAKTPMKHHWLSVFKFAYASQRSVENMSFKLLEADQPDLSMIFLIANDPISHTFWHFFKPRLYRGIDQAKAARLGTTIPNFYSHNDAYLGRLQEIVGEDTVIMVVSDHGFAANGLLPKMRPIEEFSEAFGTELRDEVAFEEVAIGQTGVHHIMGVFMAAGGPIRSGVRHASSIYDIAPTILALQGMPIPEDMPGRVLEEIIDPEFLARYPIERIPSYRDFIERTSVDFELQGNDADEDILNMLRSLGYIEEGPASE